MHYSTFLAVASVAGLSVATPLKVRAPVKFPSGISWDIILNSSPFNTAQLREAPGEVIDIDLFDHSSEGSNDIKELAKTKKVICYFSAGSRENWRKDAGDFGASDYGAAMKGWDGENWVNVKSENVRKIMKKRIEFAAASGCHAVDPDNVDGYNQNQDRYSYDKSAYVDYIKYLSGIAKDNNLAIGLKNGIEILADALPYVDFTVNEQCHEMKECDAYKIVTDAGKAAFTIEYHNTDCTEPKGVVLSQVNKGEDEALNTIGGQCKV